MADPERQPVCHRGSRSIMDGIASEIVLTHGVPLPQDLRLFSVLRREYKRLCDRIDYGWEMALLLQREKLKLGGLRFCHKTYVNFPNHPKRDGPGSVFQARMALWMQAKRWGVDMIHFSIAPFHFTHNQGWPNTAFWEALFGFSIDEPCVDDLQLWCGRGR